MIDPPAKKAVRVLFIGKFPPIQGGVAADAHSLVAALLHEGLEIEVVSDCLLVESDFRIALSFEDIDRLQFSDHPQAKNFTFSPISPFGNHRNKIPGALASESLLYGRCARSCKKQKFDVVISNYLVPYSIVGALISKNFRVPHIILHAGSDLFDLTNDSDLLEAISNALNSASVIITVPAGIQRLAALGIDTKRCRENIETASWQGPFYSGYDKSAFSLYLSSVSSLAPRAQNFLTLESDDRRPDKFLLGICGKAGVSKGSYELIEALRELEKTDGSVRCMASWAGLEDSGVASFLRRTGQPSNLELISPMPRWRVPEFINYCDALLFLEHDFWLSCHTPQFPREVIASGSFGVFSTDIYDRFAGCSEILSEERIVRVASPMSARNLVDSISKVKFLKQTDVTGPAVTRFVEAGDPHKEGLWSFLNSRTFQRTLRQSNLSR